tara:strand:+ start:34 stop:675 length:642 start_codon:yes stop_codon:yes gene_type:complete
MTNKNISIKYLVLAILVFISFTSCEDNWGEIESNSNFSSQDYNNSSSNSGSSSGCTLNCSIWEDCVRRGSGDPFDFFGPKIWVCENIFTKTFNRRYNTVLVITDEYGNQVDKDIHITSSYPNNNSLSLNIQEEGFDNRFDIIIEFLTPSYGDFVVNSQTVYNPILNESITYSGTGSLTKNGSRPSYTIILDLNYTYNGTNYNYNCIGSDAYPN